MLLLFTEMEIFTHWESKCVELRMDLPWRVLVMLNAKDLVSKQYMLETLHTMS